MTEFRPVQIKEYPGLKEGADPESSYWKKFSKQILRKEIAPVTYVEFAVSQPHLLAYTSSTRIEIFDPQTHEVTKSVTRFKDVAYSGSFRSDGTVIAGGSGDGSVSVFHLGSRDVLRRWKGHKQPVHVTRFGIDKLHLISGADDSVVKQWEMTTDDCVRTLQGHKDYVRCGAASTHSPDLWYTGSYDHTVIQWDTRTENGITAKFDHGAQVDALVLFPSGGAMATAGGQFVKIWDILTGKLMHTIASHQKAITALALDGAATRLLSGGLDQQVKIFDVRNFTLLHSIKYPAPILSLAVSPDNSHICAGMNDGSVSIRYKAVKVAETAKQRLRERALVAGTHRYFMRGKGAQPASDDQKVLAQRATKLRPYEQHLKSFHYSQALDAALATNQPPVILTLLEELQRLQGLVSAISDRDDQTLKPLMTFLTRNMTNPRYSTLLVYVCNLLIDRYAGALGQSTELDSLFFTLRSKIRQEVGFQRELMQLSGMLECLIASAQGPGGSTA